MQSPTTEEHLDFFLRREAREAWVKRMPILPSVRFAKRMETMRGMTVVDLLDLSWGLTATERAIVMRMVQHGLETDEDGVFIVSCNTDHLAAEIGSYRNTVMRAIRSMVARGVLTLRTERKGRVDATYLLDTRDPLAEALDG